MDRAPAGRIRGPLLCALVPVPGDPVAWTDPVAWQEALDAWIVVAGGQHRCVDAFVALIAGLPTDQQATFGLPRVERLLGSGSGPASAGTLALDRRLVEIREPAEHSGVGEIWQEVVDAGWWPATRACRRCRSSGPHKPVPSARVDP
jgi:hypothetical protein